MTSYSSKGHKNSARYDHSTRGENDSPREDRYPSRNNQSSKIVPRQDPVTYSSKASRAPIPRHLIDQYEDLGFVILEDIFSASEVKSLEKESFDLRADHALQQLPETITEPGNTSEVRSIFNIHKHSSLFKRLSEDQRLAGLAQYILSDDIYLYQSRLNYKPGFHGKKFYWHSDFETWHVEDGMPRMRALSMSITLTENFYHNGPLMLIPRSHKQYVVCEGKTPANNHELSLKNQIYGVPSDSCLAELSGNNGITTATCKPGSVILFDCNTMHGSNGNITPYPRSNIFFVYNAISNRVEKPFCPQPPRPEYICSRNNIATISIDKNI